MEEGLPSDQSTKEKNERIRNDEMGKMEDSAEKTGGMIWELL